MTPARGSRFTARAPRRIARLARVRARPGVEGSQRKVGFVTDDRSQARRRASAAGGSNYLPYLLSLPALLVCIGILIPFVTAVYYSLLRLPPEPAGDEGLHLVRATTSTFLTDRGILEHGPGVARIYGADGRRRARVRPRHRDASAEADPASTTSSRSCCCCR